jgi:type II secretory pathway component PulF
MNSKKLRWVRFTLKDQLLFARRLSFLLNAHVPLSESLRIIRDQTTNRAKRTVFDALLNSVTEGQHLSRALTSYERLFGTLSVHLIEIGEHSGTLARNLFYLANELEKKQALRRKIMGALSMRM